MKAFVCVRVHVNRKSSPRCLKRRIPEQWEIYVMELCKYCWRDCASMGAGEIDWTLPVKNVIANDTLYMKPENVLTRQCAVQVDKKKKN